MNEISVVICELNPMHSGHEFIFEQARKYGDTVVAVMSGNFVQRGECAVYDKYKRAKLALTGADLVLELPFPWSASSAEFFARASVSIAEAIGASDLVFGSECGDISALKKATSVIESPEYKEAFRTIAAAAQQRENLLSEMCPSLPKSILSSPNDILGCEYCRFLSSAMPHAVKRISTASASSLRTKLNGGDTIPGKLSELEFYYFRTSKSAPHAAECGGGVGERLYNAAMSSNGGEEMLRNSATKQYTNARLRRAALFAMTGVSSDMLREKPAYSSVLAANEKGRRLLSSVRRDLDIEILTNPSDSGKLSSDAQRQFEISSFADGIYTLCMKEKTQSFAFNRKKPFII